MGAYLSTEESRFNQSDGDLSEQWFKYLPKLFPQFDPAMVSEEHIFRFPAAQHVVDTEYESKIPTYQTPLSGVFLSNFSQIFPEDRGTNFAIREGEKVALEILKYLKLPTA
jgi:hypothetical protein